MDMMTVLLYCFCGYYGYAGRQLWNENAETLSLIILNLG